MQAEKEKKYIGSYRLWWGYLIGLVSLFLASEHLYLPGVIVALIGIGIRVWAAGCINKNSTLAMRGPYAFTRNPLYVGSLVLGIGMTMAVREAWLVAVYVVGFAVFYWPTIRKEERDLDRIFGDAYLEYKKLVPAFFPWKPRRPDPGFSLENVVLNREHRHAIFYVLFLALMEIAAVVRMRVM